VPAQTNHDLAYTYGGTGPHQATRIGDTSLVYDGNGNTVRECRDPADATCTERPAHLRRLYWTEENRLDAVIDGGGRNVTKFYYDASGERIAKLGRGGESITVGQFWSVKGRRAAMKHVFVGAARVASKLLPPPGWDDVPRGLVDGTEPSTTTDETGCDPSNYSPQKCQYLPGGDPVLNDYYADAKVRPETYYYHPDHLGSTSWVTDQNARVHERVEYFPYGAVWRDTRSDIGASPVKGQRFLFTGKEIDEETGLYYFGARYYDPVRVLWKSVDPADRFARAGDAVGLNVYQYAAWSPTRYVDPAGRQEVESDAEEEEPPFYERWWNAIVGVRDDVKEDFERKGRAVTNGLNVYQNCTNSTCVERAPGAQARAEDLGTKLGDHFYDQAEDAAIGWAGGKMLGAIGSVVPKFTRRVNMFPSTKGWGITDAHWEKHIAGNGPYSLQSIDPSGSPARWFGFMADLFDMSPTGRTSNGMIDIIREFPKADGSGTFKLGVRLFERADGTFDLVTILTKQ
jgi:RHS repeat-associated protein